MAHPELSQSQSPIGSTRNDSPSPQQTNPARLRPPSWFNIALRIGGRALKNFAEDRGTQMAAAISYYALFSLLPLLILTVALFGLILRDANLQIRVIDELVASLPILPAEVSDVVVGTASNAPQLAFIAFLGVFWTSGALSASVRTALNVAFEVRKARPALRGKIVDYTLLPVLGLPVLGSVLLSASWQIVQQRTANLPLSSNIEWLWEFATLGASLLLSFLTFALLYWLAPNRQVRFRYLWPGALFAAFAFEGLKYGFTIYLTNFASYEILYGALGGVVVLLFWVFLSANILIIGAEIANEVPHVLHEEPRHGHEDETESRSALFAVWKVIRWLTLAPEDAEDHVPPGASRQFPSANKPKRQSNRSTKRTSE